MALASGVKSFTLGTSLGLGYVNHPNGVTKELIEKSRWQIEVAGELYDADGRLLAKATGTAMPTPFSNYKKG